MLAARTHGVNCSPTCFLASNSSISTYVAVAGRLFPWLQLPPKSLPIFTPGRPVLLAPTKNRHLSVATAQCPYDFDVRLTLKADIRPQTINVRFVPKADITYF